MRSARSIAALALALALVGPVLAWQGEGARNPAPTRSSVTSISATTTSPTFCRPGAAFSISTARTMPSGTRMSGTVLPAAATGKSSPILRSTSRTPMLAVAAMG